MAPGGEGSVTTTDDSILARALQLQAEARRRSDTAKDRDEAMRVAAEVESAEKLLDSLDNLLDMVAALREHSGDIELGELDSGLKSFEKHAGSGGLPSRQAVSAAVKKLSEVQQRVRTSFAAAWREWAGDAVRQLPTDRLALIGHGRAGAVNRALDFMRQAIVQVPGDPSEIARFVSQRAMVQHELLSVEDPGPHLRELLKQLQDGTTLDQLSDDDVAVLRARGWAPNILVKRADLD
jgi:hypothetical protein